MNIDLGSFAFGSYLNSGSGTPSWGTALGQSRPDYKFTYPGAEVLLIGMVYCSVPLDRVSLPLGKGGRIYQASEVDECQLTSLFRKVYINGIRINYPFLMVLVREESDSHTGRRSIKYSDKNSYQFNGERFSNQEFIQQARRTLNLTDDACWFIYSIEVYNQDELHMSAVIVDENNSVEYENSSERKNKWLELIPDSGEDTINSKSSSTNTIERLQQIFYGAPGTGKSNTIKREVDDKGLPNVRTTFHPDSDYSTFVGAYKPIMGSGKVYGPQGPIKDPSDIHKDLEEPKIIYEFVPQAFLKAYTGAWKNLDEPFFLIIEEINRGNCAQIFGDLFQLLDRNDETDLSRYPISPDEDIQKFLLTDKKYGFASLTEEQKAVIPEKVLSGELMILPPNLHIWATMNTSDQSLFPIDSAFKRRWDWQYMPISDGGKGWQIAVKDKRYDWWQFLQKINAQIGSTTNSEDKKLGYFFCKAKDGVINVETFVGKVVFYIWNDVFKDFAEEAGDLFKDVEGILSFNKFYTIGIDGKTRVIEEKVERLLQNLGVEPFNNDEEDEDDDGNKKSSTNKNFDKFSINDKGNYGKNRLPFECIKEYVNRNSEKTADEVLEIWGKMNPGVPHFIESDKVYNNRTDISKKRSSNIKWNNGSVYVVLNGYGSNGMVEKFMDNVNNNELLGLKIERIINQ